nr:MAG: hypothetical protein BECKDK2373C_GA0170839_104028 [Candidatus Kentron sp. DK]
MTLQERIVAHTRTLPENRQREVWTFIQSIASRDRQPEESINSPREPASSPPVSALELALAHGVAGCVKEAPADLSENKDYLRGYGE